MRTAFLLVSALLAAPAPSLAREPNVARTPEAPRDALVAPAEAELVPLPYAPCVDLARVRASRRVDGDERTFVSITLRVPRERELAAFADAVCDPRSPLHRRFASPEELAVRFGPTEEDVERVVRHLEAHGLVVDLVARTRVSVLASGAARDVERAFATELARYELDPRDAESKGVPSSFRAPTRAPRLPRAVAAVVADVAGLDGSALARPCITQLTPALVRGLYGTNALWGAGARGAGRTIGIANFGGFRLADAQLYLAQYALPTPPGGALSNVTVVPCAGGGAGAGTPFGEGDLDLQMVLGIAPLANVRVYDSPPSQDLIAVLTQLSNDDACDLVTESWTWNLPASTVAAAHVLHLALTAQGITYVAASGDSGTTLAPFGYPQFDPEVLVVGGTTANAIAPSGLRFTEIGWSGSGGGWSSNTAAFNVRPSWQFGNGVPALTPTTDKRLIPDVALHAAGNGTGAYPFFSGGALVTNQSGTSFAAPVLAASLALVEEELIASGALPPDALGRRRLGRLQDVIYAQNGRPDLWFDVVAGANGTLPNGAASTCAAGWDTVTGFGAPDFERLTAVLGCPAGGACGGSVRSFCEGDDTLAPCPCDNVGAPGNGCASSTFANGAHLAASGTAVLSSDTVVLDASDLTGRTALFLQASVQTFALTAGDGLGCLGGTIVRLGTKPIGGGTAQYPEPGDLPLGARGSVPPLGGTFYYQCVYRNASAGFCTSATSNRTNGLVITWSP